MHSGSMDPRLCYAMPCLRLYTLMPRAYSRAALRRRRKACAGEGSALPAALPAPSAAFALAGALRARALAPAALVAVPTAAAGTPTAALLAFHHHGQLALLALALALVDPALVHHLAHEAVVIRAPLAHVPIAAGVPIATCCGAVPGPVAHAPVRRASWRGHAGRVDVGAHASAHTHVAFAPSLETHRVHRQAHAGVHGRRHRRHGQGEVQAGGLGHGHVEVRAGAATLRHGAHAAEHAVAAHPRRRRRLQLRLRQDHVGRRRPRESQGRLRVPALDAALSVSPLLLRELHEHLVRLEVVCDCGL
mmetsp:Transcript_75969/g.210098  ORF Transcript_75969/g.210098 Transcript_75969/m.210098 type:complete len:305 (-) Transcript_75969:819-1733(-)